jgi:hypothetical protein
MGWAQAHAVNLGRTGLVGLMLVTLALQLAAGVGLAWVAGFHNVHHVLTRFSWPWIFAIIGALGVSLVGYYEAYRGTFQAGPHWSLPRKHMWAIAFAGFGGFLAHGATALDVAAVRAGGADERETAVRVSAFGGLEYGVMAVGGCGAAIAVLVLGLHRPPPSFTLPWAIIPVPGFLLAFWLAHRYRERLLRRKGWRHAIGIFLQSIQVVRDLFHRPVQRHPAALGMAVFWAGDTCAAWCGLAAFGLRMNVAQVIVGFATGMIFTRRSTPLAGTAILAVVLPITMWLSGAPLEVAVPGLFVYHLLSSWLPVPLTLRSLHRLRAVMQPTGQSVGTLRRAK